MTLTLRQKEFKDKLIKSVCSVNYQKHKLKHWWKDLNELVKVYIKVLKFYGSWI